MRTNFLNKVAAMSGKNVNELVGMSQSEVVNKVILPIIVQPTGQDGRIRRILLATGRFYRRNSP